MKQMKELLANKKILITGASSGIGRAAAVFCVKQGAKVVITGRDEKRLRKTREMCDDQSHCFALVCDDLGDTGKIETLFQETVKSVGPLDGVIHSAGIAKLIPLQIISEDSYNEHMNIHVKAATFIAKEFQKKKNHSPEGGSLVFISSVAAYKAAQAQALYAAAKAAQIGLTKTLAVELVAKQIRVNAIASGAVKTEMGEASKSILTSEQYEEYLSAHPLGQGSPDDIAYGAAFLLSDYSRWITGTTLTIDGGISAT